MNAPFRGLRLRLGRRSIDPGFAAASVLFLLALAAAAWPALRTDPASAPGLLLLIGLAGVAFLAVFAFGAAETRDRDGDALERLLAGFEEPAALATPEGRILAANAAWTVTSGGLRRLPRGPAAPALFVALAEARAGRVGRAAVRLGELDFEALVSELGEGRFLVRAATEGQLAQPRLLGWAGQAAGPAGEPAPAADEPERERFAAAAPFGAAVLDNEDLAEAKIASPNRALLAMAGDKAAAGAPFAGLIEPASLTEVKARLEAGAPGPYEVELALAPRRQAHLYVSAEDGARLVYLIDLTERKQLELNLAQAQKMQAIGQLAGGVAHDFNNLLTAIQLRLDELLQRHPVGDPSYEGLNEIRQTGVRAADLVRKLLAFSRKQTVKRETLELGELISEFEVLLRRLLREDVKLETEYGRDLPLVHADKSQLETAVMNLAVNARDAVRTHNGGKAGGVVRIRTARLSQAEARGLGWAKAPKDSVALIEVSDTGPGIPQDLLGKIFEPFFTTKPVGEGTGMGLATVYGIVEQADGCITADNAKGAGAVFRIFLPVHTPKAEAPKAEAVASAKPARAPARDLSGAGKILFVEDEDAVRGVAARLLRARGYEVIEASDGEEALALAEAHAGEIDMLISDVIMPGLDGPSLLKKARPYLGGAPVMFISGYAEAEFSDLLEGETGVSFLPKPIDIKTLAERVKMEIRAA
jgi:two-component system, cell cycle sensor histidine kinase and response regulator CckA